LIYLPLPSPTAEAVGYYLGRIATSHSFWLRLAALGWFCAFSPNFFIFFYLHSPSFTFIDLD
jgi:hypothetical protein